ncbi:lipopolysaccharide heptosyltransferase I [Azoarcus olearius]|uniref:Lipopolysaccharide heptosyltransferase 1 n=1 Tax=Azoarcus sp. (strain BH72) TaxID=418699 RepID=A1KBH6_AZOSB|nr:lipopolysaccharide heptosyltransferase I [Azoarcus olearius]CAL96182.1 lipopolysaccharide heptosyltransferase I [Azoarcus olearius]
MRVLVIKTSSLGDVIHTLPALTDAARVYPDIRFDWVVEEPFAEIPAWHPNVERVIPVAVRRWRKHPLQARRSGEWRAFRHAMGDTDYDAVIDAQGLLKSAWLSRYARSPVHGLDRHSAREPVATLFYRHRHPVPWGRHAVRRVRELFAHALGYTLGEDADATGSYGIDRARLLASTPYQPDRSHPYLVFLHATTWPTKHWPESYWRTLAELASGHGWHVHLPWGNAAEGERAQRLAAGLQGVTVLPRLTLTDIAAEIAGAAAAVAVDTGLGHLAAALEVPTVSLFGPTNNGYTGAWGRRQLHLAADFPCSPCLKKHCEFKPTADDIRRFQLDLHPEQPPCFTRLPPERVWSVLETLLVQAGTA